MHRQFGYDSKRRRCARIAAALTAAALCLGCQAGLPNGAKIAETLDVRDKLGWKAEEEGPPPPEVPARLVTTWVHAVRHQPGQKPQRGFGGRIVFFGNEDDDPVRVDGQLVVYAFEEDGREDYETQPTKRFIFRPDAFAQHEGDSPLGPTYSVWLGWDEVGGPQRNISLITRFEPKGGAIVVGEQTRHLLPGVEQQLARTPLPTPAATSGDRSILQASHSEPQPEVGATTPISALQPTTPAPSSSASTTIQLPDSLKQRLKQFRARQATLREIQQGASAQAVAPQRPGKLPKLEQEAASATPSEEAAASQRTSRIQPSALDASVGSYVKGNPLRGSTTGAVH